MWGFFAHQSVQDTLPIKQNNKKSTTTEIISSVSLQQLGKIQFMSRGRKKKKKRKQEITFTGVSAFSHLH